MSKVKLFRTVLLTCLITTCAGMAEATVLRAFVSSTGNDTNVATNCAQSAPCRTFTVAFTVVTPGGELIALDSSGYGPISNVNKAITIAAVPGATAFVIVATGTNGFTINGAAADTITLRNLSVNGTGAANTNGVLHNSGRLIIKDCEFTQLTAGLRVTAGNVLAVHSSFSGNPGRGVYVSGTGKVDLENCDISFNGKGVTADGAGGCPFGLGGEFVAATVTVRLNAGQVVGNTTLAFEMMNPGTGCLNTTHGTNIFLRVRSTDTDFTTDVPGYRNQSTNFLSVTGAGGVGQGSQVLIGVYKINNQGLQP